ncbi:hypothetical protein [Streptomyces sp. RKAG293]|uniref:hypothetical protein n=1 Tax=Streptomyces sp. RKAG293 TaxID=2893403 RepID=UPI002033FB2D|nr:hypothetical protein [Streptomyces sp. RKAG293]MCM2424060.1 hypothetical protein [Streptomyces sp. RKAG293]
MTVVTRSRTPRALAVFAPLLATALVLVTPDPAVAQCAASDYRGGRAFPSGGCPTHAAATASATVWVLLALAAAVWLILAMRRARAVTDADLAVVDASFAAARKETSSWEDDSI